MSSPRTQHLVSHERASRPPAARLAPLLLSLLAAASLAACAESTAAESGLTTAYGAAIRLGNGTARTYVVASGERPVEVGVELSAAAFAGLPADHSPGGVEMPDGHHTYDYILAMPATNPTPYRFVGLGWNPVGHEPPGIYDQPHFDFHFYTMSEAERAAILPSDPQFAAKAARRPAPEHVPAGYTPLPGAVPLMGAHWVDPASPELNGQPFTQTFIYGTWDGALTFAEPMVTKAFLESKPDVRTRIAVPARYAAPGYYPTEYRVYWDAQREAYRVALSGLARQQ